MHENSEIKKIKQFPHPLSHILFSLFPFPFSLVFLALLIFPFSLLPCLDFSIRPKGFVSIPMGNGNVAADGNKRYSMGGGGEVGFEIDLATIWPNPMSLGYTLGLEGGMFINPMLGDSPENVSFYSGAGVLGLYIFPLSRLFLRVDGAAGGYVSSRGKERSDIGLYWRGGGELGFRFTPAFTIAANGGWRQFTDGYNITDSGFNSNSLANSGFYTGLTVQFTFQAGSSSGREGLSVNFDQYEEMFPVFMQLYQKNPIGSVVIHNTGNAEIRNVSLSFRAEGYTASEFPCGTVSLIPRGRSAELPLYADFSPEVLRFTDKGRILGELVIRYRFLGQERETAWAVSVATHNRNMVSSIVTSGAVTGDAVTGSDAAALAAFISPTSPETLDFSRFVAGLSRANRRIGHNQNMQYSIWLLEGLRASNIRFGETYASPNEAQFPAETLAFKTGGSRDLALLFSAGLEGVGISSAFIQTEDDFLVAANLRIGQSAAETLFYGTEKILIINEEVWLPLSMNAFNEGFMAAWTQGALLLDQVFTEGREASFVILEEAWAYYPPAPLPELEGSLIRTDTEAAAVEVGKAMQAYVIQEINPLIMQTFSQYEASRQDLIGRAAALNRLGILYTRAGEIDIGKAAYEQAAWMGSVPAMTNRGNLALIERDFAEAEQWFAMALSFDSENRTALRGMERVQGSR